MRFMRGYSPAGIDTDLLELGDRRIVRPQRVAVSKRGMVATQHYLATDAAVGVLADGGNAMDAAVTAAFALGVCEPTASGLGGQTMMMIYDAESGRKIALDGSSRAPHRVVPGELSKKQCLHGHCAATVPSTPAVLAYALKRYGTKGLGEILAPAVRMAEEGCRVTQLKHDLGRRELSNLRRGTAAGLFLREGRRPYPVGAVFRQPVLARTLRRIAEEGVEDFYLGEIARIIHDDMLENDGLIRDDDLAQVPWPIERKPLSARFEDMRVLTFGPPGAGRTLVEILNILGQFKEKQPDIDTPRGALLLAEVIRHANVDRSDRPFDPNLHPQESAERMLSTEYAKRVARRMRKRARTRGETTHLSVIDMKGNVVSLTQSIERVYGSFEASPRLGFLYNNYMSAFEYDDISHPYYLRPNAVPWASVAPTIVFRGRWPWLAIGSPGSERIVSTIVQVLLRLRHEHPFDAVDAPRLHCSLEGRVSLEASRMRDDIPGALSRRGFEIDFRDPYSFFMGCVQLVMKGRRGEFMGVADPRRDGSARGPNR
jgi:gamma-glutamyltranspeptidase/glutathione hydrolase